MDSIKQEKEDIIQDRWDLFVHNFIKDYALNYAVGNWVKRR